MTDINALIASAIPVQPPDDWFDNPHLGGPTAIRVTPDGRVFGHVASWDMDHIGMPHGVRPPRSRSGYAYFKTGEIMTASGSLVPVGQLTLAGGHAGLSATAAEAVKHYDDTNSAIADVSVGEDQYGIWVAGALRPHATAEQVRSLRASAPSGDWRMINGRLEMVAVCQVNVPGFPIPRALAAGGARMSLVAAGSIPLLAQVLAEQEFEARLQRLETLTELREQERLSLVASAAKERINAVRQEHLTRERETALARVKGLTAAGPSQGKRDKAAKDGHALPDGSFPINTEDDLRKAVKAYGRAGDKAAAKRHITKRARALGKTDVLPDDWSGHSAEASLTEAAGDFHQLSQDYLSKKAKRQNRDRNGRFMQQGSFLRWKEPGGNYQYGQVLNNDVSPDGSMTVRVADSKKTVQMKPHNAEVIRAILPSNQVTDPNQRGIPFQNGKKRKDKKNVMDGSPGPSTPGHDPSVVTAPAVASDQSDEADYESEPEPAIDLGDDAYDVEDGTLLGTVTDAEDPTAIEVTDENGVVTVHDESELDVVPDSPADDEPVAV